MDTDIATCQDKGLLVPLQDLRKTQSAPADVLLDYLALQDMTVHTPDGVPVKISRMRYIADFLTKNLVMEIEEEIDGSIVIKQVLNKNNMKALTELLKLKSDEEKRNNDVSQLAMLLDMYEQKRGKPVEQVIK